MDTVVNQAKSLATEAHKDQKRFFGADKGKPYIIHPERVASNFPDYPTLQAVAWLHDVVEDTDITAKDLAHDHLMPTNVVIGVIGMTRKKDEPYVDYILRVKKNPFALPVKIADIKDNLESLPPEKKVMKDKYQLALYILEQT